MICFGFFPNLFFHSHHVTPNCNSAPLGFRCNGFIPRGKKLVINISYLDTLLV